MNSSCNNFRIFKNSMFLYFRTLVTLSVAIYTSRVVLNSLGVEDFGIYNVVGGVVTMMAFLSGAMSSSTQRFLSFELGKNNIKQLHNVFNMSVNIHWLLVIIVLLISETLGLWFLNAKLVIPSERLVVANFVYQCALFSFCCSIIGMPYSAVIIAHEKMRAFSYISIIESLTKLIVVFFLSEYDGDKLIYYSFLLSVVSLLIFGCYYFYCRRMFSVTKFSRYWNTELFKIMFNYTSWNLFGNLAYVAANQGVNILLNVFFGAAVNAARAIAVQINAAINSFVTSLQMSINPQIVKSYASDDLIYMHKLIIGCSKYAFFLLYLLALPILLQTDTVLKLWLITPPQYADLFCQLMLVDALIISLSGSLMASVQATGNVKRYQAIVGGVLLLNLPASYCFLSNGASAHVVFYISICASILALFCRFFLLKKIIDLDVRGFFVKVIWKISLVVIFTYLSLSLFDFRSVVTAIDFIIASSLIFIFTVVSIYILGLERFERKFVNVQMRKLFNLFRSMS
ncbi:TPA: lipopolysaccharide biosynthesis protein [Vibrio metoecus]